TGTPLPDDIHLPVAAERIVIAAGDHRHLLARAHIRSATADAILADGSLETPEGVCVVLIAGMRFVRADAGAFAEASSRRDLYDIAWHRIEPLPHAGRQPLAGD